MKCYAMVIIEFQKDDKETLNDVSEIVKGNIENSLGTDVVKYISICDENGERE